MQKIAAGVLGAAAVAASLIVLRLPRQPVQESPVDLSPRSDAVPAGERVPGQISLERLRELGF